MASPPRITCRSPALRGIRDSIVATGLVEVEPSSIFQRGRTSGADWLEHGEPRRVGRVAIRPGPLWIVSPRRRDLPFSLRADSDHADGPAPDLPLGRVIPAMQLYAEKRLCRRGYLRLSQGRGDDLPRARVVIGFAPTSSGRDLAGKAAAVLAEERDEACIIAVDTRGDVFLPRPGTAGKLSRTPALSGLSPWAAIEAAEMVVSCDEDEIGLAARLLGIPVLEACTKSATSRATHLVEPQADLTATFAEAVLRRPVYLDPWSREPVPFEDVAEKVAWLRDRFHENDRRVVCVGFSKWKHGTTARLLDGPCGPPLFTMSSRRAASRATAVGGRVVVWEACRTPDLEERCARLDLPVTRMEDGFIRSVGLGSALLPGASFALDDTGIYFDSTRPSALETLCRETEFTPDLIARAARLRQRVVATRLSKYNVGDGQLPDIPAARRVVLVPGQVEDDRSILLGSPSLRSNAELLRRARARNPDAFLIYKPHPDVEAGFRSGAVDDRTLRAHADAVARRAPIADLIDRVDAVETMTSLAGFEAMVRGKHVAVHGRPFYAGWGLSEDLDPPPRRGRTLSIDELFAAAILLYPRYIDPVTGLPCPPEIVVDRLLAARDAVPAERITAAGRPRLARAHHRMTLLFDRIFGQKREVR